MATKVEAHPLDDCDPTECYQTMMSERTSLITARREAEDNLIKTVIQLAAALLALLAGFISQAKISPSLTTLVLFAVALGGLAAAIIAGLMEQRFSSRAYLEQQKLVEDYFQKKIHSFDEPDVNKAVRKAQATAFVSFVAALVCLGIFAFVQARESYVEAQRTAATVKASVSAGADAPANSGRILPRRSDEVVGAVDAATPASEKVAPRNGQERPDNLAAEGREVGEQKGRREEAGQPAR